MESATLRAIGFGFVILSLVFVSLDYLILNQLEKKYSNLKELWDDETYLQNVDRTSRKLLLRSFKIYQQFSSHKMRRLGIVLGVFGVGIIAFWGS